MAVLLAATSCNRSNNEVVLIDPDDAVEAVLEDVACDIRIIPLKSDKPIPNAILFYFYDDYFFSIAPNFDYAFKDISVFDNDGNLLGTIDQFLIPAGQETTPALQPGPREILPGFPDIYLSATRTGITWHRP